MEAVKVYSSSGAHPKPVGKLEAVRKRGLFVEIFMFVEVGCGKGKSYNRSGAVARTRHTDRRPTDTYTRTGSSEVTKVSSHAVWRGIYSPTPKQVWTPVWAGDVFKRIVSFMFVRATAGRTLSSLTL